MTDLAQLLTGFDVSVLFAVIGALAQAVGMYLTPVLLIVSIYIRLMETQIDGLTSGGKYGTALRDMVLWTFALGAYFGIANLVMDFFNPIYTWIDGFGSLATTMDQFDKIMSKNEAILEREGIGMTDIIYSPYTAIAALLYYTSLVIVAFLTVFLKIANVLAFGVAFVWGLIAIPMSISTTFKMLRGWAYLMGLALAWPIVQGLMMAMFTMLFTNAAETLMSMPDSTAAARIANIMMLFAVMHLLLAAVLVAAPLITNALVTNSPSGAAVVMPFVGAAVAAGLATVKGGEGAGIKPSSFGRANRESVSARTPAPRAASSFSSPSSSSASSRPAPSPGAVTSSSGADDPGPAAPSPGGGGGSKKRQQRRGSIIQQNMRRPKA